MLPKLASEHLVPVGYNCFGKTMKFRNQINEYFWNFSIITLYFGSSLRACFNIGRRCNFGLDQAIWNDLEKESASKFSFPGLYSIVKSQPKSLCNKFLLFRCLNNLISQRFDSSTL